MLAALAGLAFFALRGSAGRRGAGAEPRAKATRRRPRSTRCRATRPSCSPLPGAGRRPRRARRDSPTAARFKGALRDSFTLLDASRAVGRPAVAERARPGRADRDHRHGARPGASRSRAAACDDRASRAGSPASSATTSTRSWPIRKIDLPMYEPLKAISIELFLPNINLIAPNSITLIETNQRFIEAYMVGLNHEFARKLLWREYPTDQRGSYFRQFWDVRSFIDSEGLSDDRAHARSSTTSPSCTAGRSTSDLGDHNNRAEPGRARRAGRARHPRRAAQEVSDRGHLRAARRLGARAERHTIDLTKPRKLVHLDAGRGGQAAARQDPQPALRGEGRSRHLLLRLRPDGRRRRRAAPGKRPTTIPGWFFVIKERPGEPRFGLELTRDANPEVFDELTWDDALPGGGARPVPVRRQPRPGRADAPAAAGDPEEARPARRRRQVERRRRELRALGLPAVPRAGHGRVHADEMLADRSR